jgi:FKBP-type peptidyl-prolyl cis-trans isomerase FkpA
MTRLWLPLCLLVPFTLGSAALAEERGPQEPSLTIEALRAGDGAALAPGLVASFAWRCALPDGTEVASSPEDKPLRYRYQPQEPRMIAGWSHGVAGMRVGERRLVTIPPSLAYGPGGVDAQIPPWSPLVFEIDLLALTSPPHPHG